MEQQQQQQQPGSQSPLHWLSEMMPDLPGDENWLLPHQELGTDLLAQHGVNGTEATNQHLAADATAFGGMGAAPAVGRQTRKRNRLDVGADEEEADPSEDTDECVSKRGGARKKGAAAKEQKKINEKARRQRENDFIAQLAQLLDPARAGRADKLSTLADAVKEIMRLRADTASLQRLNKILEERVADLKARQEFSQNMMTTLPPLPMFMQQVQQQTALQHPQQSAPQQQTQPQPQTQPPQQQAPTQPQQVQMQPQQLQTGMGGSVMVPMGALQQMLAAHQARYEASLKAAGATVPAGFPAAFKAPNAGDVLSSAACLYMPSSDLDVSADSIKRPPAA